MLNGPILVLMNYTLDGYKGGVIRDTFESHGDQVHAVRIVGWGSDGNETRHWLAANSYDEDFGENGRFRVEWGHNLMNIET